MYTQCPQCHAIFHLTPAQIAVRGGLVRCGQCATVFRADQYMFDTLPETLLPGADQGESAPAPAPPRPRSPQGDDEFRISEDSQIPTMNHVLVARPRPRRGLWMLASLVLLTLLIGQLGFLYRDELAREPQLRPWIERACAYLDCVLQPPQDVGRIELAHATVMPHPDYAQALFLDATIINRAEFAQPYPLLEVTLTDSNGQPVARRTFRPQQYLTPGRVATANMPSNVAVPLRLEFTQPDARAIGYEIQLLPP
jgi:predicted Zn finger-like uncharacterized protein